MMNGKSPKDFAFSQVYGKPPQPVLPSASKKSRHPYKSTHSMSLSQSNRGNGSYRLDSSHDRLHSFENTFGHGNSVSGEIAPSIYTMKSNALMDGIRQGGSISQTVMQADRSVPSGGRTEGTLLLSDQQLYSFEKENKQKAHIRAQSEKEKKLIDRLSNTQDSIQEKEFNRQFYEEKLMHECTFSPRLFDSVYNSVHGSSQMTAKREPNFYEQSMKMKSQYDNHLDVLRQSKQNETQTIVQDKPKLSKRTKQLSEYALEKRGLNETNVVDRLHYEKIAPEPSKDPNTYQPQISAHANSKPRTQRVDIQLFEDAKKRQQEKKEGSSSKKAVQQPSNQGTQSSAKKLITSQSTVSESNSKSRTKKNERAVASKFDREFQQAVGSIAFSKDPTRQHMPETITYLEMIEILQTLRFVSKVHSEENPVVATQVQRVWNQLSAHHDGIKPRVLVRNLEVFLFAVQNIKAGADLIPFITEEDLHGIDHPSNHLNPDFPSPRSNNNNENISAINRRIAERAEVINNKLSESKRLPIGQFDENDNLYYSDEQVAQVHKLFNDICVNRRAGDRGDKLQSVRTALPQHSFTPAISETSRKLALEKRERVIGDLKSNEGFDGAPLDINEILRYQQQLTRYQNEQQKLRYEDEQLRECTFHPQTKDFSLVEKYFSPRFPSNQNLGEDEVGRSPSARDNQSQQQQQRRQNQSHGPATSTKSLGVHRSVELYALAKPNNQRRDREKGDIEYERECDECTFSPDISNVKLSHFNGGSVNSHLDSVQNTRKTTNNPNIFEQKGVQKSIERTKQARLQKQLNQSLQLEGTTFSAKKRNNHEHKVSHDLQHEHHVHYRSTGTRSHPLHNHGSHYNNRVVQASPKPEVMASPNHDSHDFNPNLTGEPDSGRINNGNETSEFYKNANNNANDPNKANSSPQSGQFGGAKPIEEDRVPLLFVDVNIEDGKTARIIVYEGERSEDLANKFAQEHNLDSVMTGRLKDLLDQQINSLLTKIDEEVGSDHDEEEEDEDDEDDDEEEKNNEHEDDEGKDKHDNENEEDEEERVLRAGRNAHTNSDDVPSETQPALHSHEDDHQVVYTEENLPQEEPAAPAAPPAMTDEEIREMQMRALAMTFKNFAETKPNEEEVEVPQPPAPVEEDEYEIVRREIVVYDNDPRYYSASAMPVPQQPPAPSQYNNYTTTLESPSPQNVMDLHMRALATTFKNYTEDEEKQKNLPSEPIKAVTSNDIESMHMRAMAATYTNYTNNPERIATLPTDDHVPLSHRSQIRESYPIYSQNYSNSPMNVAAAAVAVATPSHNAFTTYNDPQYSASYRVQEQQSIPVGRNANSYLAERNNLHIPSSYTPTSSNYQQQTFTSYVPQVNTYNTSSAVPNPAPASTSSYVRNSYQFETNPAASSTVTNVNMPPYSTTAASYLPPNSSFLPLTSTQTSQTPTNYNHTSQYALQQPLSVPQPLTPSSSLYAQYTQQTGQSAPYMSEVRSSLNSYIPSQYAPQTSTNTLVDGQRTVGLSGYNDENSRAANTWSAALAGVAQPTATFNNYPTTSYTNYTTHS